MVRGVSTHDYANVIDLIPEGFGVEKSSVSRDFVQASAAQVKALAERRFDGMLNQRIDVLKGGFLSEPRSWLNQRQKWPCGAANRLRRKNAEFISVRMHVRREGVSAPWPARRESRPSIPIDAANNPEHGTSIE
jgi:hypothetical protein